jgi:hypothetical protein
VKTAQVKNLPAATLHLSNGGEKLVEAFLVSHRFKYVLVDGLLPVALLVHAHFYAHLMPSVPEVLLYLAPSDLMNPRRKTLQSLQKAQTLDHHQ